MELRDLRALISIAEYGTLSGAAHRLNLTQPALSALLRRLENELEVQIVTRHSRGVSFTAEGNYLLEKTRVILRDVADTQSTLRDIAEEPVGSVRLGLPTSIAGKLIPALFPALNVQFSRIQLHIIEAMSGSLVELLQMGKLDLAVLFDIQPMPGLRTEPILIEEIRLMVRRGTPLAALETVSLNQLVGQKLVLPSRAHSIRQLIERSASSEGIQLEVAADIDSLPGLVGLVQEGYATALPPYLLMGEIASGLIKAIRIERPSMEWTLHLATRIDINRPRAAMVVGRMLVDACAAQIKSRKWPGRLHPKRAI